MKTAKEVLEEIAKNGTATIEPVFLIKQLASLEERLDALEGKKFCSCPPPKALPDLAEFRASIPSSGKPLSHIVNEERDSGFDGESQ